jgi:hypothetical protein
MSDPRAENLFLELDMDTAWKASGFVDVEAQETQNYLDRRYATQSLFPARDIYNTAPECYYDEALTRMTKR